MKKKFRWRTGVSTQPTLWPHTMHDCCVVWFHTHRHDYWNSQESDRTPSYFEYDLYFKYDIYSQYAITTHSHSFAPLGMASVPPLSFLQRLISISRHEWSEFFMHLSPQRSYSYRGDKIGTWPPPRRFPMFVHLKGSKKWSRHQPGLRNTLRSGSEKFRRWNVFYWFQCCVCTFGVPDRAVLFFLFQEWFDLLLLQALQTGGQIDPWTLIYTSTDFPRIVDISIPCGKYPADCFLGRTVQGRLPVLCTTPHSYVSFKKEEPQCGHSYEESLDNARLKCYHQASHPVLPACCSLLGWSLCGCLLTLKSMPWLIALP